MNLLNDNLKEKIFEHLYDTNCGNKIKNIISKLKKIELNNYLLNNKDFIEKQFGNINEIPEKYQKLLEELDKLDKKSNLMTNIN
jgi:hypothetical protein